MNTWLRIKIQGLDQAPVPQTTQTSDPDPWSRPLIQTFGMIQYMGELMSCLVMVACFFGVSCSAIIHPAKQPSNKLLQSHAAKLSSFQAALVAKQSSCQAAKLHLLLSNQAVYLPMCWAVQQPSCDCCTSKLSSCQADTVLRPSSQAVRLLPSHLVVLFLPHCIQPATYAKMWVQV